MTFKRPKRIMRGETLNFCIDALVLQRDREVKGQDSAYYNPNNQRTVMGLVVPEFQRDLVWSEEQQVRLIESIWAGIPIGTYTVNFSVWTNIQPKLRNIVIDGQQRLFAIESYLDDKIKVGGCLYSELSRAERREFENFQFPVVRTASNDEEEIREYYNRMNFGGTAHAEEQRA